MLGCYNYVRGMYTAWHTASQCGFSTEIPHLRLAWQYNISKKKVTLNAWALERLSFQGYSSKSLSSEELRS